MRGLRTGPARKRKGCLLLFIFMLPIMLHFLSLMFPAAEVFDHYDKLDRERRMELQEEGAERAQPKKNYGRGR